MLHAKFRVRNVRTKRLRFLRPRHGVGQLELEGQILRLRFFNARVELGDFEFPLSPVGLAGCGRPAGSPAAGVVGNTEVCLAKVALSLRMGRRRTETVELAICRADS